jgi:hypothetical protein
MDAVKPSERNKLVGLLADALGGVGDFMEHKDGALPVNMLSQLLGIKPMARTLDRLSYGDALGSGAGMTWKPLPDTVDAAFAAAPLVAAAPTAINNVAAAAGRRLEPAVSRLVPRVMDRGGLPAEMLQAMAQGTRSNMNRPKYLESLVDVLKSGKATDVTFGKVSTRNEKQVNALRELLGQPMIQRGDQWVIPQNVVQKLMEKRMGSGRMSAEKVADTLNSAVHSTRNRVFQSEYPQIQGMLTPKEEFSNLGFVGVNPRTGEPVIKSGYKLETDRANKVLSKGNSLRAGRSSAIAKAEESASYRSAIPEHTGNMGSMPQPTYSPQYQAALDAGLDMSFEARMQRAAEQGYTMPVYHGSNSEITAFDPEKFRTTVQYMPGVFTADSPELASNFGDVIYPLLQRQGVSVLEKANARRAGIPAPVVDSIHNKAAGIHVTNDPANLRSVNAAFNPANIGKADLLGRINPQLLPWLAGGGLLGEAILNRDK